MVNIKKKIKVDIFSTNIKGTKWCWQVKLNGITIVPNKIYKSSQAAKDAFKRWAKLSCQELGHWDKMGNHFIFGLDGRDTIEWIED